MFRSKTQVDENRIARTAGRGISVTVCAFAALALVACSSDDDDTSPADVGSSLVDDDTTGDPQTSADPDGDDRPGLVINGLNGKDPAQVFSPWLATIDLFRQDSLTPGFGTAFVGLTRYDDDVPIEIPIEFYTRELDTCEIYSADEVSGDDENDNPAPPRISGGASIVINMPSGPWATIPRIQEEDDVFYSVNNELPGALPEGATLSIPGETFPTVAAYPLVEPVPPVRLTPEVNAPLTGDAEISWVAGINLSGFIRLDFEAYDSTGNFIDFVAECNLLDDGAFELPDDMIAFIDSSTDDLRMRYSRRLNRVDFIDGIVLFQNSEVAE